MIVERQILNQKDIQITIERLCQQLIEHHGDFKNTVIVGVQPRGTLLCSRIIARLRQILNTTSLESGSLDISFYRDDLRRRDVPIIPEIMDMNLSLEAKNVVLIDDVLFTGRSIRSAIDALMAFGRPKSVELLTLIDRRFNRDLPIQPNYVGKAVDTIDSERVIVEWKEENGEDRIIMVKSDK